MRKSLSFRLALQNVLRQKMLYIPFMIASSMVLMIIYILKALSIDYQTIRDVTVFMDVGVIILRIFSIFYFFYLLLFIGKQRQKEYALYQMLGMEKRQLLLVNFYENTIISIITIGFGIVFGVLFKSLSAMILSKMIQTSIVLSMTISWVAIKEVILIYLIIFMVVMVFRSFQLAKLSSIALKNHVFIQRKNGWIMGIFAIVGIGFLTYAYIKAQMIANIYTAIMDFMVLVIMVIVATYLLFNAGSYVLLTFLKKRKQIYYQKQNMMIISGLRSRVFHNAMGLGNIAILSTMVIILFAGTFAFFAGVGDVIQKMNVANVMGLINFTQPNFEIVENMINKTYDEMHFEQKPTLVEMVQFDGGLQQNTFSILKSSEFIENNHQLVRLNFITKATYEKLANRTITLAQDEYSYFGYPLPTTLQVIKTTFHQKEKLDQVKLPLTREDIYFDTSYVIVHDFQWIQQYQSLFDQHFLIPYGVGLISNQDMHDQYYPFKNRLMTNLEEYSHIGSYGVFLYQIDEFQTQTRYFAGSFFFLGLLLSICFSFTTMMIIFYKQVSEGYQDVQQFHLLQKIGFSQKEVKQVIHKQIIYLFFAPLLVAVCHVIASYKLINFVFSNATYKIPYANFVVFTILGYSLCYAIFYQITANTYYKIVK